MKGQINIGNIGWYLLQAQEGNINAQEMDALCAFLEEHPELVPETDSVLMAGKDVEITSSFTHLKKEDFELGAFETLAVSVLEGERRENDLKELLSESNNLQLQWKAFKHTKLVSETITFSKKGMLYRKRVQVLWLRYAAAACMAALFFGLGWMIFSGAEKQQMVDKQPKPVKEQAPSNSPDSVILSPVEVQQKLAVTPKPEVKNIYTSAIPEIPKRQEFTIETLAPIERAQLITTEPQLLLAENIPSLFLDTDLKVDENAIDNENTKVLTRVLRYLLPGNEKQPDLAELDWLRVLANAGNQGLDQISKGRIEFSYQPERDNGPEAYLKIGNFSISRSIASN